MFVWLMQWRHESEYVISLLSKNFSDAQCM